MTQARDRRAEPSATGVFIRFFRYVPTVVWAPVLGFAVMTVGVFAWQILARVNVLTSPSIPWSTPLTAIFLWVYFRYFGGAWWPRSTQNFRRGCLRANPLKPALRSLVIATAVAGLGFTLSLHFLSLRLIDLPPDALSFTPKGLDIPWWTLWVSVIMASIVAGICEEAGIRGYLQSPVERRHGAVPAVILSALVFTVMHFNRELGIALAVPFFISALWYGALTSLANSIIPMIFVHISLDIVLIGYHDLLRGPLPQPFQQSGPSAGFIANGIVALAFAGLLIYLLLRLKRLTHPVPVD